MFNSDQRGGGITGERRGMVKSRNMYEGPMGKDNGVRGDGMWEVGWAGHV